MSSVGDLYAPNRAVCLVVNAVVAYTGLTVDRPAYEHFVDNKLEPFLNDFPHGKISRTKNGVSIVEGAAIARYLAALAPESGLLPTKLEDQAVVDSWTHLIEIEMFNLAVFNFFLCHNVLTPFSQELSDQLKQREERALSTINKRLEGRTYLVGDQITLADITLAASIKFTIANTFARAEREKYPNVVKHFERLAEVTSLKELLGGATYAEGPMKYNPDYKP